MLAERGPEHLCPHASLMQVYNAAAAPVEEFFREQGTLLDFDIYGSIPETLPRLLAAIGSHTVPAAARKQRAAVG